MAVAFVRDHVVVSAKAAGTTLDYFLFNPSTVPAGNLLVAVILFDNAATASKPIVSSIGKAAGETNNWVFLGAARSTSTSAGAFASGELWAIKTTVAWSSGVALTMTLDTSITMKAVEFIEFSGAEATLRSTVGTAYSTTTTAASAVTTGTTPVVGDLALGFLFGSNAAAAQAGDTDTLGGAWSAKYSVGSTGGNVATNNFGIAQYKILTAASHQTYNNSAAMTAGNGSIVAILQATIDPLVVQAAYRFYADGTETGSTALGTANTAYTADLSAGDVNLQLRTRLQEANGGVVPASTDWQLQYEKNASGTWTNASDIDVASIYSEANEDNWAGWGDSSSVAVAVSIQGNGKPLRRLRMKLFRAVGNPASLVIGRLYAGTPPGATLLNGTSIAGTSLPLASTWVDFDFDGSVTLNSGTNYSIGVALSAPESSQIYRLGLDASSPTYAGNTSVFNGTSWAGQVWDGIFEVHTSGMGSTVIPYDSPNLTGAAATTNRLTGGTGTFQPGEVSEDSVANDLGWTASNFTELLYSITLKQADLANGDVLAFRVLKDGATTGVMHTVVPTINVTAGPSTKQATVALTAVSTLITVGRVPGTITLIDSTVTGTADPVNTSPAVPAGLTATDLSLLLVGGKNTGSTPSHTVPSGWTRIGSVYGTSLVAPGPDTGSTTVTVYYRVGTYTAPTIVVTNMDSMAAGIVAFRSVEAMAGGGWDVSMVLGDSDTSSGPNYQPSAVLVTSARGDVLVAGTALSGDIGTTSAHTITAAGATVEPTVTPINQPVTTGNQSRLMLSYTDVSAGSGTNTTYAVTNPSSTTGSTVFLRIRDLPAVQPRNIRMSNSAALMRSYTR